VRSEYLELRKTRALVRGMGKRFFTRKILLSRLGKTQTAQIPVFEPFQLKRKTTVRQSY
jgi:hypothetical protein